MWIPEPSDIDWMKDTYAIIKEGGIWVAPMSGQQFKKSNNQLIWLNETVGDKYSIFERSKIIGKFLNIKVLKESESHGS